MVSSQHLHHQPPGRESGLGSPHPANLRDSLKHIPIADPEAIRLGNFPNFLILGPQRTGSTWLFHNLKKHPQVFLPRDKETYFFTTLGRPDHPHYRFQSLDAFLSESMSDRPRRWIKRQYDCLRKYGEPYHPGMRGEATATGALMPGSVIRDITRIRPGLKAILMLRDPVERAWSHARKDLVRNSGRKLRNIPRKELERFFRASGQRALADYAGQIRRWSACLEPGNLFIGEFESISSSPEKLLTRIHAFLGIRGGPRYFNRHLHERINAADSKRKAAISTIPPNIRQHLEALLEPELEQYHRIRATLDLADGHRAIHRQMVKPPAASSTLKKSKRFFGSTA